MKKILLIVGGLLMACEMAFCQCPPQQMISSNYQFRAAGGDTALRMPQTQLVSPCWLSPGSIEFNAPDSSTYQWTGTEWIRIRGAGSAGGLTQIYGKNHISVAGADTAVFDTLQYRKIFNVVSYGADTSGVADATPGVQAAINAAFAAGGGQVYFPRGNYKIAGAFNALCNCQLYIPLAPITGNRPQITLQGESSIAFGIGYLSGAPLALPTEQVVLRSTISGTGTYPNLLAMAPGSGPFGTFNYTEIRIRDIGFELYTDHGTAPLTVTGLYLFNAPTITIQNVFVAPDTTNTVTQNPSAVEVADVVEGHRNNDGPNLLSQLYVSGAKYGVVYSEHTTCIGVQSFACEYGHVFPLMDFSIVGDILHHACNYGIYSPSAATVMGSPPGLCTLNLNVESEIDSLGSTGTFWYNSKGNIVDTSSYLNGQLYINNKEGGSSRNLNNRISQINNGANNLTIFPATQYGPGNLALQAIDTTLGALMQNMHFNRLANTWTYINNGPGAQYLQFGGGHYFRGFASSTAGATTSSWTRELFISNAGVVGVATETPAASAQLDIESTTRGFLPPRMTTVQKLAIAATAGLLVYDTTLNQMSYFNGTAWTNF